MRDDELAKIRAAIVAQEGLLGSGVLPDEEIRAALTALREREEALRAAAGRGGSTHVSGDAAVVAAQGGAAAGGDVAGSVVNTGTIAGDISIGLPCAGEMSEAELLRAYLAWVRAGSSYLMLSGVDPAMGGREDTRLSLSAVYTTLLTSARQPREAGVSSFTRDGRTGERRRDRTSALEQLNRHARLVLQGDPGSGKSTFVNFVTLCLAGEALGDDQVNLARLTQPVPDEGDEHRQPWDHGTLLPVVVLLRDFAAAALPAPGSRGRASHLWDFIAGQLGSADLAAYAPVLRRRLLNEGGLLLLDGLDEVPETEQRRLQVKQAIEDFADSYDRCRVLVTSRTFPYQSQDWRLQGFEEAILAPFTDAQIRRFVDRWYAHAAALGRLSREDAAGRAALLEDAVFRRGRLLGLARRPLLLTLIASLHAWRGGNLPEKRERLYADTVDLLLDFWEQRRLRRDAEGNPVVLQPSIAEWLEADREQVRGVLETLACEAHASQPEVTGTADISEDALVGALLRLGGRGNPVELVRYLRERAGLLLPRGDRAYTFPHRSFQEYLAACHLTGDDFPDEIAGLARRDPDRWREVALLAGAKAARGAGAAVWQLVDALCYRGVQHDGRASPEDMWGALIAAQALAETADLARVSEANRLKLDRVKAWLLTILSSDALAARERARAGEHLARLGDDRFDEALYWLPKDRTAGFLEVPAGTFRIGSNERRDTLVLSAAPRHELNLPAFFLARWPVTVDQFRAFVDDSGYADAHRQSCAGVGNAPVVYVTWHDAVAYCRWLSGRLHELAEARLSTGDDRPAEPRGFWSGLAQGRLQACLPSEAEWEKAARGADGRAYPWGWRSDPDYANLTATGIGSICSVGCFPCGRGPFGHEDMTGNIWEWTRSLACPYPYPETPEGRRKTEDLEANGPRVLRGGAVNYPVGSIRCAFRADGYPSSRVNSLGFRVAVVSVPGDR